MTRFNKCYFLKFDTQIREIVTNVTDRFITSMHMSLHITYNSRNTRNSRVPTTYLVVYLTVLFSFIIMLVKKTEWNSI